MAHVATDPGKRTIWDQLESAVSKARRATIGALFEALAEARARREEATFSIALIALSAKLAKADGVVTDDEIVAFRDFFDFPEKEERKVRMIYDLAQQDVAGFDHYLSQVAGLFEDQPLILEDVLDCLYHIALSDGIAHPAEMELLDRAAEAFSIKPGCARRIRAAHMGVGDDDPYFILGVEPAASLNDVKAAYRKLAQNHHPDALISRGLPASLVKIGEGRMAAVNEAYERILAEQA
ncbi:MAG: molecular chaperone DjiA [Pseudomonadota bacterium]